MVTAFRRVGDDHTKRILRDRTELLASPITEAARRRIGHATPGRHCPSCPASRAEHDGYGCERTGCQVPHWRLIPTHRSTSMTADQHEPATDGAEAMEQLAAIARAAYEGDQTFARARLVIAPATKAAMTVNPPTDPRPWTGLSPAWLTGIPVFLDDAMPVGAWRLLDPDGRELKRGGYPEPTTDHDGHTVAVGPVTVHTSHGMIPGSHERPDGPECRCGAAWDRQNDRCATAPTTVDPVDLLALIRQAIGDTWATPEPVSAEEAQAVLSAVVAALTAAGWTPARPDDTPGQVEPDDAKPQPVDLAGQLAASLRQAKIDRLTRELTEAHAVIDRQAQVERTIRAERDDARAMVDGHQFGQHWARLVKGLKERGESSKLVSLDHAVTYALAAIDRLKVEASNYAHDRDEARRERDAISAEFDAAQTALIAQRDAERERADQLAREHDHLRNEAWQAAGRLAAFPVCYNACHKAAHANANALRVALDGPTTAPNTTQPPALERAMHSVWLHGKWAWLTRNMTTEQREAASDAVDRVGEWLSRSDGEDRQPIERWWRDGPAPNATQPLYVDADGKPTGFPRVEVTADVHIVPAGPASSPTTDAPAPGQGQDTTDTREADHA